LANRLHRADLAPDWCAMIVGLHFLPLAKIFRAPNLSVLGSLMMLWCALCWALFRSNTIAISGLAWNWNPALGHLCLRIVSSPKNRAIT